MHKTCGISQESYCSSPFIFPFSPPFLKEKEREEGGRDGGRKERKERENQVKKHKMEEMSQSPPLRCFRGKNSRKTEEATELCRATLGFSFFNFPDQLMCSEMNFRKIVPLPKLSFLQTSSLAPSPRSLQNSIKHSNKLRSPKVNNLHPGEKEQANLQGWMRLSGHCFNVLILSGFFV